MKLLCPLILSCVLFQGRAVTGADEPAPAEPFDELFKKYDIVPEVIATPPKYLLEVIYPNETKVILGNELTPSMVKDQPRLKWDVENDTKYTLIMSDSDAPGTNEFLHWLIVDIPGYDVHSGKVMAEYIAPGPPKGTGLHRYVFSIFKQDGFINFTKPYSFNSSAEGRGGFSIEKFATKYNLGKPLAGNFFLAEYDDYVPMLRNKRTPEKPECFESTTDDSEIPQEDQHHHEPMKPMKVSPTSLSSVPAYCPPGTVQDKDGKCVSTELK